MRLRFYPDPVLRRHAAPIVAVGDGVRDRVAEMFEIMYREGGVGLAAPQVGWSRRVFVMNPAGQDEPESERVFINPVFLVRQGSEVDEEGCLSIPDVRGRVERSTLVRVRARDLEDEPFEIELHGLAARIVQHENDHLDGILFTSRLSETEKLQARKGLRCLEKEFRKKSRLAARGC